ncbi:MAG: hypothetical protein HRT37_05875 [Alteromonadaceae bacterium]|nr:hypothetical protein [Alteromonadaceae bacterium]
MKTIKLNRNQKLSWLGRYDYSPDKVLKIFRQGERLKMEITEWVFSDLHPVSIDEMKTDISGLRLKKMNDGSLSLIQRGQVIFELNVWQKTI